MDLGGFVPVASLEHHGARREKQVGGNPSSPFLVMLFLTIITLLYRRSHKFTSDRMPIQDFLHVKRERSPKQSNKPPPNGLPNCLDALIPTLRHGFSRVITLVVFNKVVIAETVDNCGIFEER